MNKSLTRSIGFWLLPVLSLVTAGIGGWLVSGQIATMTSALVNGTATGVEVYVGQSLVVVGAALLGTGILGILLTLVLSAAQALVRSNRPVVVEPIDWAAADEIEDEDKGDDTEDSDIGDVGVDADQNGSSGSTATATKISVR